MSYANINDPSAVSAILDQLRASKAWKDLINIEHSPAQSVHSGNAQSPAPLLEFTSDRSSVTALLSQLQTPDADKDTPPVRSAPPTSESPARQELPDLKSYTFQQALSVIAKLSSDPAFISEIQKLKEAQDNLERHLWEERRAIQRRHEEKMKFAKTKASMIGVGISKHEADMINGAYKKDLEKFDLEHALPAFDDLVAKQQAVLVGLNVPTMYVTNDRDAREGQQRVIQVLGGLIETPYSEDGP